MSADYVTVRPPESPAELDAFFEVAVRAFSDNPSPDEFSQWHFGTVKDPDYEPSQVRCAFVDGRLVGGCMVFSRLLRMGPARLLTGCIGGVATDAEYRHRGVASAVLRDAIDYGRRRGCVLMMLDGIPGFYGRFGFVDVFDPLWHGVERQRVLEMPAGPYTVRPATAEDAPALLALYERHYGPYTGSFERSPQQLTHKLTCVPKEHEWSLAVDPQGTPRGYLAPGWESSARVGEAAADDWPAALALLQHHAQHSNGRQEPPAELLWPLPADSSTCYALADHLPVRLEASEHPNDGWMACVVDAAGLFRDLMPLWRQRWARCVPAWSGLLGLRVPGGRGGQTVLCLAPGSVEVVDDDPVGVQWLEFTPEALVQVLFGFRTLAWAAKQPGVKIPEGLCRAVATALLQGDPAWVPGSDSF